MGCVGIIRQAETAAAVGRKFVVLADDHPIVLGGLRRLLASQTDLEVVGTAKSAKDLMSSLSAVCPSLLIMDLGLGNADGLSVLKSVRSVHRALPIVVFSMHDELEYAARALSCGANGYVMKDHADEQLIGAIQTVLRGEIYLSQAVRESHLGPSPESSRYGVELLTDRELSIFRMIGVGRPTREIADSLFISIKTVEKHRENIKRKLGIETGNRLGVEAAIYVWRSNGGSKDKPGESPV